MINLKRRNYFTSKRYQLKYTSVILVTVVVIAVIVSRTLYWDVGRVISAEEADALLQWERHTIRIVLILAVAFFAGIYLSHKIVGPLGKIEGSLKKMNDGEFDINIKLRKNDEFTKIAEEINKVASKLKSLAEKRPELKDEFKSL